EGGRYSSRLTPTDAYGNAAVLDAGGSPYSFNTGRVPGGIYNDDFETNAGWTLDGDWQIDAPQGKGTPPADPVSAFHGAKVLGQDLTGLGAHPGDYETGTTFRATSPSINASGLTGGVLRFRRKLSVGDGGVASIIVLRNGVVFEVWSSSFESDSDWTQQTVNLSPYADGTPNLKIQFKQRAGPTVTHSGWNIDRLVVGSANQPPYGACGGCGAAPSFAGASAAADVNACGDTGILVSWAAAAAWGSGSSGSYSVYRDTSASFVPGPSNRIATGVTATSY